LEWIKWIIGLDAQAWQENDFWIKWIIGMNKFIIEMDKMGDWNGC
jgi:hypothetical protein